MEFTVTELAVAEKLGIPVETVRLVLDTFVDELDRISTEQVNHWNEHREILYKDGPRFTGMFFNKEI